MTQQIIETKTKKLVGYACPKCVVKEMRKRKGASK